jgi:NADP-dependent 3-hydroxy acid dehydrogenase YdfG
LRTRWNSARQEFSFARARDTSDVYRNGGRVVADLKGKVAVVTGASRGIGRAVALRLAEAGADLALGARGSHRLERVATEVRAGGSRAIALHTDVSVSRDCDALVEAAARELGGVDILVNNAGVGYFGPLIEMTDEEWRTTLDTNLSGTFYCTRAALRHTLDSARARVHRLHIVNICSVAGREGIAQAAAYCASKFGMAGFADAVSREVASAGVRVTTIYPGRVNTTFGDADTEDDPERASDDAMTASDVAQAVFTAVSAPRSVVHEAIVLFPTPESWVD